MAKKKKQTVWHKKKGRFIPSERVKSKDASSVSEPEAKGPAEKKKQDRLADFSRSFSEQIKKAAGS